jgi:cystathionine gamma-synthase
MAKNIRQHEPNSVGDSSTVIGSAPGMSARDLLSNPLWQAADLGRPLPASRHAVSVALPRWRDVVDYEEKSHDVLAKLEGGYPRFVIHPTVEAAAKQICAGAPNSLPFPSRTVAEQCARFVEKAGEPARVSQLRDLWSVTSSQNGYALVRAFWQHTGLIVSTRRAEAFLREESGEPASKQDALHSLQCHLASFYECEPGDVFLCPTGMAAQFAALQVLQRRRPGLPTAQLGFPYVDTLKLQQKLGFGGVLLHDLDHIEKELQAALAHQQFAGCFCEIPGNPLLGSVDLRRISPLLRSAGIPLVVDDVVATPYNIDVGPYADLVATSLTKFIVGNAEAMGGALICNPRSHFYSELKAIAAAAHENLLWEEDAEVLALQALGFPDRMKRHNSNGLAIAERLRRHPAIERVWYPKWEFDEAYEAVRRPHAGWGALLTFMPRDAEHRSQGIYDRLEVCKGPSLGTVFTLACPFTLLAHYTELEWAEACGVSRFLIRLSVGIEEIEALWERIQRALT